MAQKIYKLCLVNFSEAWYQLSEEEQERLLTKVHEALNTVNGKRIVFCDSRWSGEQWPFFGVEEFPNIEAVQKHSQLLDELNWFRYIESETVLGTEFHPS